MVRQNVKIDQVIANIEIPDTIVKIGFDLAQKLIVESKSFHARASSVSVEAYLEKNLVSPEFEWLLSRGCPWFVQMHRSLQLSEIRFANADDALLFKLSSDLGTSNNE